MIIQWKRRVKYTHTGALTGTVYTIVRWTRGTEVMFGWEYQAGLDVVSNDDFDTPAEVMIDIRRRESILAANGTVML